MQRQSAYVLRCIAQMKRRLTVSLSVLLVMIILSGCGIYWRTLRIQWAAEEALGDIRGLSTGARVYVEQFPSEAHIAAYSVGGKVQTAPPWHSNLITVRFTPDATSVQKDNALSFNLACLTKFGGCMYGEQMLPRVRVETDGN